MDAGNTSSIMRAQEAAADLAEKAVEVHGSLMASDDERIKLSAAKNILDKTFAQSPVGDGGSGGTFTTIIAADNILVLKTAIEESSPDKAPLEVLDGHAVNTN